MDAPFSVTFLGTAAALFIPPANTAALLVRVGTDRLLVDCGVGAVRQLRQAGSAVQALTAVLLTHWHPDHVAGLPNLLWHAAKERTGAPLRLYAPPAPRWARWWLRVVVGGRPAVEHVLARSRDTLSFEHVRVAAVHADHSIPALSWVLAEAGATQRRLVVSGDTRPTSALASAAHGADLLVHEATYLARHHSLATARQHTTALQAAQVARAARVGMLALTHLGMGAPRDAVLAEARSVFERVVVPRDLDRLDVGLLGGTRCG
ncbi:MAG: hypothetical protein AVDCRST_MAG77-3142 [uncultured Chloroflexi bacterium]|uniref:Metallo-beta-lactamase domain-containing protein n=1 Tax=uncultured Chloroflexota bacterium TaxID=166587 RepID=A0A6J4J3U4_9CHLR|nr:MAG: hypothetical protein AVDCRST_MAG77-3142 [uncultured Chloroflexota bacterium]